MAGLATTARVGLTLSNVIFYPMIFLSGAAIPRELLPDGIRRAAVVLPLTHVVTLLQAAWSGTPWTAQLWTLAVLALTTVTASAVAVWSFRWE